MGDPLPGQRGPVPLRQFFRPKHELRAAGVPADFTIHAGVGHAFLNDSRPDAYDAHTARMAWNDILAFLRAELA